MAKNVVPQVPPMPQKSPLVNLSTGMLTNSWNLWFINLFQHTGNGVQSPTPGSPSTLGTLGTQVATAQAGVDGLSQGRQL